MHGRTARPLLIRLAILTITLYPATTLAQLTFRHALELATEQHETIGSTHATPDTTFTECVELHSRYPARPGDDFFSSESLDSVFSQNDIPPSGLAANVSDHLARHLSKFAEDQLSPSSLGAVKQSDYIALCTAVVYIELAMVNSRIDAVRRQEVAAARLLKIETSRVVERVDNPNRLTRAKLQSARTRLLAAQLERSALHLRKQLAASTGLREGEVQPLDGSIPLLPNVTTVSAFAIEPSLPEIVAAREVAQLQYILARTRRLEIAAKAVSARANVGDIVSAYIDELEKFSVLLEFNFELHRAQLLLLYVSDELQKWARQDESPSTRLSTLALYQENLTTGRPILTVMVTPATGILMQGQSQQFSAIAIYSDGTAKDVTWQATWRCSSNSGAIVSTSGLVTALNVGQVTVTATFATASQLRQITITPEDPKLLNP